MTALHNHLLRGAEPATMYMHVLGHGDAVTMAGALHAALALSKTPFQVASGGTQPPAAIDLNTAAIDNHGRQGQGSNT